MALDAFLKVNGGGIVGESDDLKHLEWIEVLSYSWGVSQSAHGWATQGEQSAARASFTDFSIQKTVDKASPKLALACCKGTHLDDMTLELCRAGGDKEMYMAYKMEDVVVSNFQPSGGSGGTGLPVESVTFNYGKITMTYVETAVHQGRTRGNLEMWWDLETNTGG
jgi:type VI secretion system secreted protein Hcp